MKNNQIIIQQGKREMDNLLQESYDDREQKPRYTCTKHRRRCTSKELQSSHVTLKSSK